MQHALALKGTVSSICETVTRENKVANIRYILFVLLFFTRKGSNGTLMDSLNNSKIEGDGFPSSFVYQEERENAINKVEYLFSRVCIRPGKTVWSVQTLGRYLQLW